MIVLGYAGFTRDSRLAPGLRSPLAKPNQDFETIFTFRDGEVPFSMFPLGYLGHDASAAILVDGTVRACAAEERFTRTKHSLNLAGNTLLPRRAVRYCLESLKIGVSDVDVIAHYCDFGPLAIGRRLDLLRPFLSAEDAARVGRSYQGVYGNMMSHEAVARQCEGMTGRRPNELVFVRHHDAHAASAFYPSGFEEALILTLDGTGETESSLLALGRGREITELRRTYLPTSLGTLYLVITVFLGFKSLGDEYKVMGLSGYGDPRPFRDFFASIVERRENGGYATPALGRLNFKELVIENLGPPRRPSEPIQPRHANIAAALQESLQETVLHTLRSAHRDTGADSLCLAGGVALNCLLNASIARSGLFKRIFVQPAASDEGGSVGAALHAYHRLAGKDAKQDGHWDHVYFGPEYGNGEILAALALVQDKLDWSVPEFLPGRTAGLLEKGKVVGWFQGRMEFGPRALGNRSILGDPRDPGMKDRINAKVKRREAFRPFAPAVLEEEAAAYFDLLGLPDSPFMLFAVPVKAGRRQMLPAVTHVDGTSRLQTVSRRTNPRFWDLIAEFGKLAGVPAVLNTSFNVMDEPIVCTPEDAVRCFLSTEIDALAIGDFLVFKKGAS